MYITTTGVRKKLGIDVLEGVLGLRIGPVLRELDGRLDDLRDLAIDLVELLVGEAEALDHARDGKGPVFLDVDTYRLTGHYIGDPQVYRPKEELKQLRETQDPIKKLRQRLGLSDEEVDEIDREVTELVEASVEFAKNGTDPKPEDALKNVYA